MMRLACIAVPVLTLLLAGVLMLGDSSGGFLPHLARAVALITLAVGLVLSWLLNLVYAHQHRGPRWLLVVIVVQTVPALWVASRGAGAAVSSWQSRRTFARHLEVRDAILADDVPRLALARAACDAACLTQFDGVEGMLKFATERRASAVVRALLPEMPSDEGRWFGRSTSLLLTCDDDRLLLTQPLAIAVAHNDSTLIDLLFPVTGPAGRREAMWTAAQLDRLAMVQRFHAAGVPLTYRGGTIDENRTLVHAAAEGHAVRVATWLIDVHGFSANATVGGPDPYRGVAPLVIALSGSRAAASLERTRAFVRLLVARGADIEAPWDETEPSALAEMIRREHREQVSLLLDVGASRTRLSAERQRQLDALLATPPAAERASAPEPGCVTRGD